MIKRAIIYDLDNTIYSVKSLGEELLTPLFELIASKGEHDQEMDQIKQDLMASPFQVVAEKHRFSTELIQKATDLLRNLTYKDEIRPFEDYGKIKDIPGDRYLVTMGFTKMQWSKIKRMGIEADFREVHVLDPDISPRTKKDAFADILKRHDYVVGEVLVVGDDPQSEIKAARELGIDSALMNKNNPDEKVDASFVVRDFTELKQKLGAG